MVRDAWVWLANQESAIVAIERAVVTVAAMAALFPLWQFWDERKERRFERVVNLVMAGNQCSNWLDRKAKGEFDPDKGTGSQSDSFKAFSEGLWRGISTDDYKEFQQGLADICLQTVEYIRTDPNALVGRDNRKAEEAWADVFDRMQTGDFSNPPWASQPDGTIGDVDD